MPNRMLYAHQAFYPFLARSTYSKVVTASDCVAAGFIQLKGLL
jgi:hypothetical protein